MALWREWQLESTERRGKERAMIQLTKAPTDRILELGGGSRPNPSADVNVDVRQAYDDNGNPTVHFTADFNEPLPIGDADFEGVYSHFALEHVSWRKVPQLLSEILRVLKPGGKAVLAVPNTQAQLEWIQDNPAGWDDKPPFESMSELLYGSQDYDANAHKVFFSPMIMTELLQQAGFRDIVVQPYGARATDMVVEATKPQAEVKMKCSQCGAELLDAVVISVRLGGPQICGACIDKKNNLVVPQPEVKAPPVLKDADQSMTREEMFDKVYFHGGHKVGGYAHEGYRDFPVHELTARHILARKPESVLEVGCARGYVLKRIQDAGVVGAGMEISQHCYLTRACEGISVWDVCKTPWVVPDHHTQVRRDVEYDLCFSIAVLEHVPEQFLPAVIKEMARTCKRGLHGVDFGGKDNGFDKTHCSLFPKEKWEKLFAEHAPGWPVEIVDKEELERGDFPKEVLEGDGRTKLNVGSFINMFHYGWTNIDIHDLQQFAVQSQYKYLKHDVRQGLPFGTGVVDLIYASHFLEHLTFAEGVKFLRECRRVIRPDGIVRIIVPDADVLMQSYGESMLDNFREISDGVEQSPTQAGKLWSLLHDGHHSCYDEETLQKAFEEAGFVYHNSEFRKSLSKQMLRETICPLPCISLFAEGTPRT